MEENLRYISQSIQRTIDVLLVFTPEQPELGLTDLVEILDLPKSTVHRAIANLEMRGLLERNQTTGKYRLGLKLFELGMRARRNIDVRDIARPHLEELSRQTGETIVLAILSEDEVLYLDKVDSSKALQAISTVGQRRPLHCTAVGKVLLAGLPHYEVVRIVEKKGLPPRTLHTITDPERLYEDLSRIREEHYSVDLGEFEEELCCVAAPIMDNTEQVVASIGIAGPLSRFDEPRRLDLIRLMQKTSQAISKGFGYNGALTH